MTSPGIDTRSPARSRRIRTASALRTLAVIGALPVIASACVPADAFLPKPPPPTLDAALNDVAHPALDFSSLFFSGRGIITPVIAPTRCPFDSTSQFFVCSPLTGAGLTLNQRFTLLDAGGVKQSAYDATTTTSLHLENDVATDSRDINGEQVLDLTGLGSQQHTLNGTSLTLLSYAASNGSLYNEERRTTITDLVLPQVVAGAPVPWPLSGTIDTRSRAISTQGDTIVFIAAMRFDGSTIVTLTITVPGGIQTCQVNLMTLPQGGVGCMGSPDPPLGRADAVPGAKPTLR